jgi:serine/threonine protein kinase
VGEGAQLDVGFHLFEYEICGTLGAGGFGITYLAKDTHLDRKVAIKEYFPGHIASRTGNGDVIHFAETQSTIDEFEWGRRTFLDEARILGKFEHPNIIRVSRYFEANNTAYIVMDYAEGKELRELLKEEGQLSEERTYFIVSSILSGLEQVHAAGLLHRDIKPGNIIIRQDGSPVLIDFGAARQAIGVKSRSISTIITPGYAPIEQYSARGNQGPWTDLYALGAVAYVCMTLNTPPEATERIRNDSLPSLKTVCNKQVSDHFSNMVAWALQPEEQNRPQNGKEWINALSNQVNDTVRVKEPSGSEKIARKNAQVRESASKSSSRIPIIAAAVGIILIAGVAVLISNIASIGDNGHTILRGEQAITPNRETAEVVQAKPAPPPQASPVPSAQPSLKPLPAQKPRTTPITASPQEETDYSIAKEIGVKEAYEIFLRRYPEGRYAEIARVRMQSL